MKNFQGIIFDFNGVLVWDSHLHVHAWLGLSKELRGSPFSSDELEQHMHGKANKYVFEYLLKRTLDSKELALLCDYKESRYRHLCLQSPEDFRLSPGAFELLSFLVEKDIPHTIATFAPKDNLDFFIEHLKLEMWFDLEKIVYDDGSYADKTLMYQHAASHLQLQPEQCIAIEDSHFGISGALQANIGKVIGLGPKETHDNLVSLGVHDVITELTQFERGHFFGTNRNSLDISSN